MTTQEDAPKERRAYHQWVKSGSVFARNIEVRSKEPNGNRTLVSVAGATGYLEQRKPGNRLYTERRSIHNRHELGPTLDEFVHAAFISGCAEYMPI